MNLVKMKKQKPKVEHMTIIGLMNDEEIRWKKETCTQRRDCIHCRATKAEKSCMEKKPFDIIERVHDEQGNPTSKTQTRHINTITIVRGQDFDEIVGWTF